MRPVESSPYDGLTSTAAESTSSSYVHVPHQRDKFPDLSDSFGLYKAFARSADDEWQRFGRQRRVYEM